jgi:protein-disulfide isomerase-like protein with CxxC motif
MLEVTVRTLWHVGGLLQRQPGSGTPVGNYDQLALIQATLYSDPACPWAYSAIPSLRVLEWRYGDELSWRLVMIGLREDASGLVERGYDTARAARGWMRFRERYGMPFTPAPKSRLAGTGRGCRAVVAARLLEPGSEWRVLRALQLANFTTPLLLDDTESIREALRAQPGIDADAIADRVDDDEVVQAYELDRAEARTAAGTAAEAQGKTSSSEGPVRFTAPSLVFELNGERLVAGGWQPLLAYDTLVVNLDPAINRIPPPKTAEPLFERFPEGLTTAEVAALLADGPDPIPDVQAVEQGLLQLAADGALARVAMGHDALWVAPESAHTTGRAQDTTAVV